MNHIRVIFLMLLLITSAVASAQDIRGLVYEIDQRGNKNPLVGVNIYWSGTLIGTVTDAKGNFQAFRIPDNDLLVFSYVGFKPDTIAIGSRTRIEVMLSALVELEGAEIISRQTGAHISEMHPIFTQIITQAELQKAACCNLSESFETNASVDVSFADAISGAKQIQLLGIHGKYSQMMFESIPNLRGLSSTYGLQYIPGPWMESIQVSKGASSVVHGFESVTGQINVEFKKPENSERLHFNMYTSNAGQLELNANSAHRFNERLSTGVLAHYSRSDFRLDHNHDSFIDHPLIRQLNVMNRWKYFDNNLEARFGVRFLSEQRLGGQRMPAQAGNPGIVNPWIMNADNRTGEAFAKIGFISRSRAATSIGWINNAHWHRKDALFGNNHYLGEQRSLYSNLIFQSYIGNTAHTYNAGISFIHDRFNEHLNDSIFNTVETVPGAFFEYTYNNFRGLTMIAGVRGDYHSRFGFFVTPRAHIRFEADENTVIRASAGTGARSARILSENIHLLASSRRIIVQEEPRMERAVNFGVNITRCFKIDGRDLTINAEAYRTYFNDQIVVDLDQSANHVMIYNLDGDSWSNSYQIEMIWEPINQLEMVLAYRWMDVRITQQGELVRKPLVNRYKGLINLSYATNMRRWQFDFTAQLNGNTRLPDTRNSPVEYQLPEFSPPHTIILAQVSRFFRDWNIYAGVENLTNFVQKHPIVAAHDPTSVWFDSSMIWGPIMGRKIYAGIRYNIQ